MTPTGGVPTRKPSAKRDRVRDRILAATEEVAPGSGLPSERDLAEQLGVSRPTVRAAIEELVRAGHLVRHHGRGTFTSPHKITQELGGASAGGLAVPPAEGEWTSRVVTFRRTPAGPSRAARFGIGTEDLVLRVTRVRLVDGEPIAIEDSVFPAAVVPGLTSADMESGNFYHLLRDRYGVVVTDAVQTLEPDVTNPDQAELLDVAVYFPVLRVERTTQDSTGRTVEHTQSVYRGDRYRITTRLRFDADSG